MEPKKHFVSFSSWKCPLWFQISQVGSRPLTTCVGLISFSELRNNSLPARWFCLYGALARLLGGFQEMVRCMFASLVCCVLLNLVAK